MPRSHDPKAPHISPSISLNDSTTAPQSLHHRAAGAAFHSCLRLIHRGHQGIISPSRIEHRTRAFPCRPSRPELTRGRTTLSFILVPLGPCFWGSTCSDPSIDSSDLPGVRTARRSTDRARHKHRRDRLEGSGPQDTP